MSISLEDRVCVVTGAGQGIGRGVAKGFAQRGARVVATDVEPPEVPEAALSLAWDVTDPAQAEGCMEHVESRFGRVDVLVANAGVYPRQPWNEISPEDWRRVLSINLDGAWYGAQAAAHVMRKRGYGKIVTVTSVEVLMGVPVHTHYDAAKMGIIGLTRSLAKALGGDGIRVNSVMPGGVRTETELEQFGNPEEIARRMDELQAIPGRIVPEEIEPVFAFLASAESDIMTGQVLCADKGWVFW